MALRGLNAISADTESDRVLKLHFDHVVTDEDRVALVNALNAQTKLLSAAKIVRDGLVARIDAAPSTAKPVFNGIADLCDAITKAEA